MTTDLLSHITIQLLKGVLYEDKQPELWNALLNVQTAVHDYFAVIGLEVVIDEIEGYAFLRQKQFLEEQDDNTNELPRLVQRRSLSYMLSLLCVLLRKKLLENDVASSETRVILTHQQICDIIIIYLPNRSNEVKTLEQIETCINRMLEFGFLRQLKNDAKRYEVQRIIKALINGEWLTDLESKLSEYEEYGHAITN